jgi:hypothetical protein
MKSLTAFEQQITPFFDLETYMLLTGHKRLSGDEAARIEREWLRLFNHLKAYRLGESKGYVLIYLDGEFERELQNAAQEEGNRTEELQMIAQAMLLAALQEVVPESQFSSCAPVPEPNKILKRSLEPLGLELSNSGRLNASFGLVTKLPFSGGCEECFIKSTCAKRIMEGKG